MSFQRAILVHARQTTPITWASVLEVASVALLLFLTVQTFAWVGAVAASTAALIGRLAGNLYLITPVAKAGRHPPAQTPDVAPAKAASLADEA